MTGDWEAAWTGGRRAVHVGNVAEYQARFTEPDAVSVRGGHSYADLAMFYSPHPEVVVLPGPLDSSWVELQRRALHWEPVEVHSGVSSGPGLTGAVLDRPGLVQRLTRADGPVLAWGHTTGVDRLLSATGRGPRIGATALEAGRRWESKAASNELFGELADDGILVPRQQRFDSLSEAAAVAARSAGDGVSVVLKAVHGVGGSGTLVVTPELVADWGGVRAFRRRMRRSRVAGEVVVEQFVAATGPWRDVTVDGVVAAHGDVHLVGAGAMDVDGTRYSGVLIGPDVLPAPLGRVAARFGLRVGEALAASGYRGWFDVDFVPAPAGRLAPTEINCRVTGPAIAFCLQARLNRVHGAPWLVRTCDRLRLGARLPEDLLYDHVRALTRACAELGAVLVPTIPSAGFAEDPTLGVALAARDRETLRLAENLVVSSSADLGRMFGTTGYPAG
ncbi:hypothetical protein [Amycolatopsis magusensis]|uniref:ATP-grasp domain-containing protein n=1 Tax=Amycolatopsis magusensis TaxID=882444 RepID=A0ABS4Q1Y5_9PSEU|nr:hypothetical protein [Amycolatopsis magusensis]MBP2185608.1 hypothetical protein [Amycolatopsis magusensis]